MAFMSIMNIINIIEVLVNFVNLSNSAENDAANNSPIEECTDDEPSEKRTDDAPDAGPSVRRQAGGAASRKSGRSICGGSEGYPPQPTHHREEGKSSPHHLSTHFTLAVQRRPNESQYLERPYSPLRLDLVQGFPGPDLGA